MHILLDENIPVDLAAELTGHRVDTVTGRGWAGLSNGILLARASAEYDGFVTMDRNIEHQQNVSTLPLGIVVLHASTNRLAHLRPLVPAILKALPDLQPGQTIHIDA